MREAFESESRSTGKDRLLITMAVPASLEYAGKVGITIEDNLDLLQKYQFQDACFNHCNFFILH